MAIFGLGLFVVSISCSSPCNCVFVWHLPRLVDRRRGPHESERVFESGLTTELGKLVHAGDLHSNAGWQPRTLLPIDRDSI